MIDVLWGFAFMVNYSFQILAPLHVIQEVFPDWEYLDIVYLLVSFIITIYIKSFCFFLLCHARTAVSLWWGSSGRVLIGSGI